MKIAFFTDSYYPMLNGVTISVQNYAKELRDLGHTVYIFAPKFKDYKDTDKDVYRLSAVKVLQTEPEVHMPFLMPHRILKEINPRDFDVIHAHGNGFFSFLGYQMALIKGIPYVLTVHTQHTRYTHYIFNGKIITPRIAAAGLRVISNMCDEVITPSFKMKKELVHYGVTKPVNVIPNFVYSEKFVTDEKGFLHNLLNIPQDEQILLSVGRLGKEKNFPFLLKAYQKIMAKNKKVHLVIVGSGEEDAYLKAYAKKLKLERIHFTGKITQQDMPKVYADADIFVFCSTTEVHPMVILEAASAGLPFVLVNDLAYENLVIDGTNGYLTPQNASAYSQKVLDLLADRVRQEQFSKESKNLVKKNFSPEKLAQEMVDVYDRVILNRRRLHVQIINPSKAAVRRAYRAIQMLDKIFE